jgi:hypothetical protein
MMRALFISLICLFVTSINFAQAQKFEFIAFGDMPYRIPNDYPRFENLIKQIQGYAFDDKKLSLGVEAPIKINDDLNDALRYVINSEIGYVSRWDEGSEVIEYVKAEQETVLGEKVSEKQDPIDFQNSVTKQIIDAFKGNKNNNNSGYLF